MSIVSNRARVAAVAVTSVLMASCAAPTSMSDTRQEWHRKTPPPEFVSVEDDRPPMILPETYFAAARLFESQGDYVKAAHQYRSAVAVNHDYADAFHRLGLVHSLLGERELAIEALARAVELRPKDPTMRNNLGFEYLLSERWEDAANEFTQATLLKPDFVRAHINLGIAQSRMQRFDDALASFRRVLPEVDAQYNLGLMYRGQRRYNDALLAFERVLELDPEFTVAWEQLQQIEKRLSRNAAAEAETKLATTSERAKTGDAPLASAHQHVDAPAAKEIHAAMPVELAEPLELAKEDGSTTPDLDFLLAMLGLQQEEAERDVLPVIEPPTGTDPVEVEESVGSSDENETGTILTLYSEDMPDDVALSEFIELCALPEEPFRDGPMSAEDPSNLVCQSDMEFPGSGTAIASDWTEGALALDPECDDFLLVDLDPWFAVPANLDRNTTPTSGPNASIDTFATLRMFEKELAEVREEIDCLESLDEEPSHVKFAGIETNRAGSIEDATAEIPSPLHWLLDTRASLNRGASLIAMPQDEEMGPHAPAQARLTAAKAIPSTNANDTNDLDGLLAIVSNELACLEAKTNQKPVRLTAQKLDGSLDSTGSSKHRDHSCRDRRDPDHHCHRCPPMARGGEYLMPPMGCDPLP